MFGSCNHAVDLIKTYHFATGPEIASRLCAPPHLFACMSVCMCYGEHVCVSAFAYLYERVFVFVLFQVSLKIAEGLLSQALYA